MRKGFLRWEDTVRPTPLSREYFIRLIYKLGSQPEVFVLEPSLKVLAGGRTIPHLYSQEKEKLCLYMPKYREWLPCDQLATTIVPWIFSWLFYFEEWLASDEWKGGGEHPRSENEKGDDRRRNLPENDHVQI
ncbi:MAG: hypothetical protein CVU57_23445 [Deltaproteobacteria bacterium HGW-Deltaproteobacteria-15]|nr:MAG: hypothetical protein CVU57_23445 [Deltaproteobacteria bacterium HGW-Deltaproteobacteria-15]